MNMILAPLLTILKNLLAPLEAKMTSILGIIPPEVSNILTSGTPMNVLGMSVPAFFIYLILFRD